MDYIKYKLYGSQIINKIISQKLCKAFKLPYIIHRNSLLNNQLNYKHINLADSSAAIFQNLL